MVVNKGGAPALSACQMSLLLSLLSTRLTSHTVPLFLIVGGFYRLRPGPVRDFGTERALAEPLGPNTGNFPSSCPRFTLLTELNLTVPKARPEAHTFDFIGSDQEPVRDFGTEQNGLLLSL